MYEAAFCSMFFGHSTSYLAAHSQKERERRKRSKERKVKHSPPSLMARMLQSATVTLVIPFAPLVASTTSFVASRNN